jgi:hypothetical protein
MDNKLTTGERVELIVLGLMAVGVGIGCVYTLILFLDYIYHIA